MHDQQPNPATQDNEPGIRTERVSQASAWLLEGIRSREVVLKACAAWGIKKRMAQVYVSKAKKILLTESWNKSIMFDVDLVQNMRVQASRTVSAYLVDPKNDPADKRVMVAYYGKLRGMIADYEKTAILANELRSRYAPSEEALSKMKEALAVIEAMDEDEDASLPIESTPPAELARRASKGSISPASAPEPVQETPATEEDVMPVPEVEEEAKEDETTEEGDVEEGEPDPVESEQDEDLLEPVGASAFPATNSHLAHSEPKAQWPCALAIASNACRHSRSEILARAQCAEAQRPGSAMGRSRLADYEQG